MHQDDSYIEFAKTGVSVSRLCLGTMMFGDRSDKTESHKILNTAAERGINFIDTAAAYCDGVTEDITGDWLQGKRQNFFVCTKVTRTTESNWIVESLDNSLRRLQTDYIDIFKIHWPRQDMNAERMMETLNAQVVSGKTRFIGCCNFPAWLFAHCNAIAERNNWAKLISNQVPYNLIERGIEVEILPQAIAEDIAITAYRPLAQGVLASKYESGNNLPIDSRGNTDKRVVPWLENYGRSVKLFNEYAASKNMHPAQLAVAWVAQTPGITAPIVGVSSEQQLQASLKVFQHPLTSAEHEEVGRIFDTEVKEESGGNFVPLRRSLRIVSS